MLTVFLRVCKYECICFVELCVYPPMFSCLDTTIKCVHCWLKGFGCVHVFQLD